MLHVKLENRRSSSCIEDDVLIIFFQVLTDDARRTPDALVWQASICFMHAVFVIS